MSHITIIDYGFGNLYSLAKALTHVGASPKISSDAGAIQAADILFLPGVGAFGDGMKGLLDRGLLSPIENHVKAGKPLFGICLGMQFLFEYSEEFGKHKGLGFIDGSVKKIIPETKCKVPHIGWNKLTLSRAARDGQDFFGGIKEGEQFYFVHSYAGFPKDPKVVLGTAEYCGAVITALLRKGNVFGTQFHPEKSGEAGLRLLKNFIQEVHG